MIFTVAYTIFTDNLQYVEIEAESAPAAKARLEADFGDLVTVVSVLIPAYIVEPENDFVVRKKNGSE